MTVTFDRKSFELSTKGKIQKGNAMAQTLKIKKKSYEYSKGRKFAFKMPA